MTPHLAQGAKDTRTALSALGKKCLTAQHFPPAFRDLSCMTTVEGVPDPPTSPMGSEFGDNGSQYGNQHIQLPCGPSPP
eukprot:8948688-Karenia_brevis.AAC.1